MTVQSRSHDPQPLPAAQPERQVEVQLGHLCNNRCVFCVSGQLSEQRRAPQLDTAPILAQIRAARAQGAQRITLLGGEPTIQRGFAEVLQETVALDFDEVVIFTNGVMTPRDTFRERVFAILGGLGPSQRQRTLWRFSLQGGDREAHDATTQNPGAWDRILQSIDTLFSQGARLSGNMCVVTSNYQSIANLAEVCAQYRFENLHLDMVRPRDAGDRTDDELRAMMARYTDMAPYFVALDQAISTRLGSHWDLNFGNVPYCTMPAVAHRIHHDGQDTVTVAADGQGQTQLGFDKYADKRSDKHKPASCAQCVFNSSCSGVFDKYRAFYGDAEFQPVTADMLWQMDTAGQHFVRLAEAPLRAAGVQVVRVAEREGEIEVHGGGWQVALRRPARRPVRAGWYRLTAGRFEASLVSALPSQPRALEDLAGLLARIADALHDTAPAASQYAAIREAWRVEAHRQLRSQSPSGATVTLQRWVQVLRQVEAAGLVLRRCEATESRAVLVWQDDAQAELVLQVSAVAGSSQPRLHHEARGVDAERLAVFSRALGMALRSAS
jgi:MoaA/NifB/PqqE/SkfB family radical SAM enzyme